MDAAGIISDLATGIYTVTRRASANYFKGREQQGTVTTLTIVASVQPASGRDLLRLPEARRSIETRVVYTSSPMFIGRQGGSYESDLVAIDGQTWEVQHVESWEQIDNAPYYRCIVQVTI